MALGVGVGEGVSVALGVDNGLEVDVALGAGVRISSFALIVFVLKVNPAAWKLRIPFLSVYSNSAISV